MRYVNVLFTLIFALPLTAFATPQQGDKVIFGRREYVTAQQPMAAYWDVPTRHPHTGKAAPPAFEIRDSTNWRGYVATWQITRSELLLKEVRASIDDKYVTNEALIPNLKFPSKADWFTGQIHIALGEYDTDRGQHRAMLIFHVSEGDVIKTTFSEWGIYPPTWNGLAEKSPEVSKPGKPLPDPASLK